MRGGARDQGPDVRATSCSPSFVVMAEFASDEEAEADAELEWVDAE